MSRRGVLSEEFLHAAVIRTHYRVVPACKADASNMSSHSFPAMEAHGNYYGAQWSVLDDVKDKATTQHMQGRDRGELVVEAVSGVTPAWQSSLPDFGAVPCSDDHIRLYS
jgi:hypothetical protein